MHKIDHNILRKKIFAENCRKSQKIVIITSTPGHPARGMAHFFRPVFFPADWPPPPTPGLPDGMFSNQKSQFG
jgi:hypothetical protein